MGSLATITKGTCAALVVLGMILSGSAVAAAAPGDLVSFTDANLRHCVNDALGQAQDASVTELALTGLTQLSCASRSISTLGGIEVATSLTYLELRNNRIKDLAPLAGLTALKRLVLDTNTVDDLSALRNLLGLELLHLDKNNVASLEPLSQLTQLTDLRVSNNQLSDLSGFESLPRVRTLYLFGNQISDLTPLAGATSLVDLRAWDNNISDLTPLAPLVSLSTLHLNRNEISEITSLSHLSSITDLRLSGNQITDLTPLISLTSLSTLMIDDNLISDLNPVQGLTRLQWFSLANNSVTDLYPLRDLTQLRNLQIEKNRVVDVSPLAALTRLQDIRMGYNLIVDLSPLATLTDLKWLGAGHNRIEGVTQLREFPQLKRLELNHNKIKDISSLASLTKLESLYLEANSLVDISAARSLPLLKWFTFNDQRVTGEPVTAGSSVPNPLRQLTTSHVLPTDSTLCTSLSCESLVYPTIGTEVVLEWSDYVVIGNGHATFSGRLVRDVTAAPPSRADLTLSLGRQTAQYEMGDQLPSTPNEWLELFEGSQVSTDPTATLEPVSADVSLFDAKEAGEYPVTFSVRDSLGRQANTTGKVVVRDTTAPTLKMKTSRLTVNPGAFDPASVEDWIAAFGVSISDAGSGVPEKGGVTLVGAPKDLSVPGTHTATLRATDNAGNVAEVSTQLVVKNPEAPALSLGNRHVIHEMGEIFPTSDKEWIELFSAEATSLQSKQQLPVRVDADAVDFNTPSSKGYSVVFTTTDLSGVSNSTTGTLVVSDTTSPQLKLEHYSLTLPESAFEKPWSCEDWITAFGASATDQGGTGVNPDSWQVNIPMKLSPDTEYRTQISVSDNEGNISKLANVSVTLQAAPTADPVSYRIAQDSEMVLDPIGAALTAGTLDTLQPLHVASPTAGGNAWIEAERLIYVPAAGFVGKETLEVQIVDDLDQHSTVQYNFEVVARPKLAENSTLVYDSVTSQPSVIGQKSLLSRLSGSQLRVSGVSTERGFRGKVELQDRELVFTPDGTAWAGRQSFSVTVQDGVNQSVEVPVYLDVAAPKAQVSTGTVPSESLAARAHDSNPSVNNAQQQGSTSEQSSRDAESRDSSTQETTSTPQSGRSTQTIGRLFDRPRLANLAVLFLAASLTATGLTFLLRASRRRKQFELAEQA